MLKYLLIVAKSPSEKLQVQEVMDNEGCLCRTDKIKMTIYTLNANHFMTWMLELRIMN